MKVNFVDLKRQNMTLKREVLPIIEKVIKEADFNMGPRLERFENEFAKFVGKKYAVGVNSGTDALLLSLMAYGIGVGDEVIVPANSYFSSAMVVSNLGAKPVFVDINPDYYNIDVSKIEKVINKKTKAIMPAHLYGQSADMDPVLKLAKKYKLKVIEDACQAHGALYKGKIVPVGETGAFSFYPGKNLGCFGDGGAIATDNKIIAEKVLHLRNDGSLEKYKHPMFGVKSRLDTIQAAVLSVKLKHLTKWNKLRLENANLYFDLLKGIPGIKTPLILKNTVPNFHLYVIESEKRDKLQRYLKNKEIYTIIHYPIPIHLQVPYRKMGHKEGDFPITEEKSKKILSLPMFPELTEKEIMYVVENIKNFYNSEI